MGTHEGLALVLDTADYRETSSLVRLLTENEGRISLIARGLRKGKGGAGPATMQAFSLVRVRYLLKEGATLGTLASAELEQAFPAARNSLEAYALVSYWFEILKETAQPRESTAQIFQLSLQFLNRQEESPGLSLTFLKELTQLCRLTGFGISYTECASCGREVTKPTRFNIRSGGVLCMGCVEAGKEGLMLHPAEQQVIVAMARVEWESNLEFPHSAILSTMGVIHRYLVYHVEHPLKTFSFVESIFGR